MPIIRSSRLYVCYCHLWCALLVAGCRWSGAGQQGVRPGRGMLHEYAQHVSGTSMTIIRSSRLYVCYCHLWCSVLVAGCRWSGAGQQGVRPGRGMLHEYAHHVSGTSMTIIRSSRLYVCYCHLWCAVLVAGCRWSGAVQQGVRPGRGILHEYAQHVSDTSMPIIRSSRLYVCFCHLWCALLVAGCRWSGAGQQGVRPGRGMLHESRHIK